MKNQKTGKFLITGTVLCALGLVLFGSGIAAGGKDYIANTDLNSYNGSASSKEDGSHAVLKKEKIDSFRNLNVDFKHIDLSVRESEDDNFYLSYNVETTKGIIPVSWQVTNGTLNLSETNGHVTSGYVHIDIGFLKDLLTAQHISDDLSDNQVVVYIPRDQDLDTFSCQIEEGDLKLDAMNCRNFNLQSNLGDLTLENLTIENGSLSDKEGDVSIAESSLNNLNLDCSAGDLIIKSSSFTESTLTLSAGDIDGTEVSFDNNCQISSKMGDIELSIPEKNLSDLALSLNADMGDIDVPLNLSGYLITDDDRNTYKKKNDSTSNVLTVQSDYGDITVHAAD